MKRVILFFVLCFSLYARAQHNTVIHGTIKGLEAGQWVYWQPIMSSVVKDSVQTVAGGFTIAMTIPDGEGDAYVITIGHGYAENTFLLLYLEKGNVTIKGEGPWFKDAVASGEAGVRDYAAYEGLIGSDTVLKGRKVLYAKANELYAKKDSAGLAALQPELDKVDSISKTLTRRWIAAHTNSPVSAFLLTYQLAGLSVDQKEPIFKSLTPAARNNAPAKRIAASIRINNLTGIGKLAPDFTQNDTLGRPVSLKDFRGKYVLVDFWASWCGPCRAENPNVVAAFSKYKDKNFTVLGVSLDQPNGKEKWLKAIHDDHLSWTQVSDLQFWNNAVAKKYDIQAIPANLLIDPQGRIIAKDLHEGKLGEKLEEITHSFTINGTVTGPAPASLGLFYLGKDGKDKVDSARVVGGKFSFHGELAGPTMATLTRGFSGEESSAVGREMHSLTFFLEPATMTMSLPSANFKKAVITGSVSQDEYAWLGKQREPIIKEMEPLAKAYEKAGRDLNAAAAANRPEAIIDTLRYRAAAIHDRFDPYNERLRQVDIAFFASHPTSYVTARMLRFHTASMSLDSVKLFYERLGDVQQSFAGRDVADEIEKLQAGARGSIAKDFTVTELDGGTLTLSSLRGKYVLIDFWASWCVPCRKSMPHVKELYGRYKGQGLEVIGVSDDDRDSAVWKRAVEKDGTGIWHNVLRGLDWDKLNRHEKNEMDISEKFGVQSLPTKILIDKDGKIIGRYDKGNEEEAKELDRLLAQLLG